MKTKFTRFLKIIALLLPVALFVFFMQTYFFCYIDQNTERIRRYYLEEENSLDVVFLGASDVSTGYAPPLAYEQYGFTSYLYAIDANSAPLYKYLLKDILSTQKPQAIVVEINSFLYDGEHQSEEVRLRMFAENAPFSLNVLDAIYHYPVEDKINFVFPFFKYHGNWIKGRQLLETYHWKTARANGPSMLKGITTCTVIDPYDPDSISSADVSKAEKKLIAEEHLIDFLEFCKKEDISNLLFVRFPHRNAASHTVAVSQVENVLEQYGHSLLNLEEHVEEIGLDFNTDFFNHEHMNIYGMEKLTMYLGDFLANTVLHGSIEQTPHNIKHWAECVETYHLFHAYAYDQIEKGIERWPGEEPYEADFFEAWLNES